MTGEEIELLNQFKVPDDKNWVWHLSKLINEGKGLKYICTPCGQPGLGPTYICERADCQWIAHKSCLEQPLPPGIMHDLSNIHHIIFMEELDNQEKVICSFCEELVSGSAYGCLHQKCNFLIHQSCIDIPIQLSKHPIDPEHEILLGHYSGRPTTERQCDLCGKLYGICYYCNFCDMAIHVKCASRGLMSFEKCHPHEFVMLPTGECQHTCQECGQQNSEIFYLCRNCRLWIHRSCFRTYPRAIQIEECMHFLTHTFFRHDDHMCKLCKQLVDKRYAAYICKSCNYTAHLWCACDIVILGSDKTVNLQEIKNHFSHPEHTLVLSEEQPEHDQCCRGCMDRIVSPPFYGCITCQFFLHVRCAKLPPNIELFYSPTYTFALLSEAHLEGQQCFYCERTCTGFVYFCEELTRIMDVQCSLLQRHLKHEAHKHRLQFVRSTNRFCDACQNDKTFWYFNCASCNFDLCWRCVTYPLQVSHRDHEHLLNLTYEVEDNSGKYYCLICEKKRDPSRWFYYCSKCNFTAHLDCAYLRA